MLHIVTMRIDHRQRNAADLCTACQRILSFDRISGLSADESRDVELIAERRIFLVDVQQHIVLHQETTAVMCKRFCSPDLSGDHSPEEFILHAVIQQHCHIAAGAVMIILMQTGCIHKMRILHAQFCRLRIHLFHEGFFTSCQIERKRSRTISPGWKQISIDIVQGGRRISRDESSPVCIGFYQTCKHFFRKRNHGILRIRNLLNRKDGGHHLGHRSRENLFFAAMIQNHLPCFRILEKVIVTEKIRKIFRSSIGFFRFEDGGFLPAGSHGKHQHPCRQDFPYHFHHKKL